jgi:tetratricopeptide (TPR) repeat protein
VRVRRLLLRGLSPSADARHASMPALLGALGGALAARQRWATGVAAAAVVAVVAGALVTRAPAEPLCSVTQAERSFGEAWSATALGAIDAAFRRTGRASAQETARRVADALGQYRRGWVAMHVESCRATHERGEQSAALLDLRTHCLGNRRDALRALVAQLARASDGEVVDRAVQAALGLPGLDGCADAVGLASAAPLPAAAAPRAAITELGGKLAEVRALSATGQYAAALPGARDVVAAARGLGYAPLLAEALHTLASTQDDLGQIEESMRSAREGALAAGASRDDSLVAQALIDVTWGYLQQAKYDEALALSAAIEAILARGESAPAATPGLAAPAPSVRLDDERATYLTTKGRVLSAQGRYVEAVAALEDSIAIRQRRHGPDHWRLAAALNNLGEVLRATGRYDEALAQFSRARSITERALGAEHPNVGAIVNNIGTVYERQNKYDDSKAMYELSLRIDEATFGPEHARVAISLMNLGALLDARDRADAAVPLYTRALAIQRKASGDDHPELAMVLHNLGLAELHLGKSDLALTRFREALRILQAALPADHVNLSMPMLGIGDALLDQRRPVEALAQYQQALDLQAKVYPADSLDLAYALQGIARASLEAGRIPASLSAAERLVAVYAKDGGDPDNRALAEFALAQAMWAAGKDRARSLELARGARQVLERSADRSLATLQKAQRELAAWLGARGG